MILLGYMAAPSEPTLARSALAHRQIIAHYAGYGRTAGSWTTDQIADIEECWRMALGWIYAAHDWSFLRPIGLIETVADKSRYEMPGDFGGFDGPMTVRSSTLCAGIEITSEHRIRSLRQSGISSGYPQLAALAPAEPKSGNGQRFHLEIWPTPGAIYSLEFRYYLNPNYLSESVQYPPGTAMYPELFAAAARAAAESFFDETKGDKWAIFQQVLTAAVRQDASRFSPQTLGYNGDPSMGTDAYRSRRFDDVTLTLNGVEV